LELTLESAGTVVAQNRHVIAVADPSFAPPPGLSDGTTRFGDGSAGSRRNVLQLDVHGLAASGHYALERPGFGRSDVLLEGDADAHGAARLALVPGEYVLREGDVERAHFVLTRSGSIDVGRGGG